MSKLSQQHHTEIHERPPVIQPPRATLDGRWLSRYPVPQRKTRFGPFPELVAAVSLPMLTSVFIVFQSIVCWLT